MLRVLVIAADRLKLVEPAARQPAPQQVIVQPGAPGPLHRHARPHRKDTEHHVKPDEKRKQQGLMDRDRGILCFERIEEMPIPQIDAVGDAQACEHDCNEAHAQQPCPA